MADIRHLRTEIQRLEIDSDHKRRMAQSYRLNANSYDTVNDNKAARLRLDGNRFDEQSDDMEEQIERLRTEMEQLEQKAKELEDELRQENDQHTAKVAQLTRDINNLRGENIL
ncbi:MAG: hypothetical protein JWN33_111 [Candidatus Saccharibacteria bacterium]|nr:hypothetical protein [Candidatus Saccharibacteria bacterium]